MDGKRHSTPADAPPAADMHKHHSGSGPAPPPPPPPPQGGQQYSQAPPQAHMGAPGQDDGQQRSAPGGPPPGGYYQQQAPQAYQGGPPQHGHYQGGPPPPGYQGGPPPQGYQQGGPPPQFVGGAQPRGNRLFNDEEAGCDIACVVVAAVFFPWSLWCAASLDVTWQVGSKCALMECCRNATADFSSVPRSTVSQADSAALYAAASYPTSSSVQICPPSNRNGESSGRRYVALRTFGKRREQSCVKSAGCNCAVCDCGGRVEKCDCHLQR